MDIIASARQSMHKVLELLKTDLGTVRTGRAAPSLVENIVISAYGGSAKLKVMEAATVSVQDNQTLVITPFDHTIIGEIQKGIEAAHIGLSPVVDGQILRITIPPLSEERRQQLIQLMKQKLENGRIMVRQARHEAMTEIKKSFDNAQDGHSLSEDDRERLEKEVQKVTDETIANIEQLGKKKEEELMQI